MIPHIIAFVAGAVLGPLVRDVVFGTVRYTAKGVTTAYDAGAYVASAVAGTVTDLASEAKAELTEDTYDLARERSKERVGQIKAKATAAKKKR